jgi:glycosyltransferase involved in cell wall biosynthesis
MVSSDGGDRLALGESAADRHIMTAVPSPLIAVCIPTYNQGQFVARAVESALRQTGFPHVQVWVSDDASTDDTAAVMTALCARDPRVHYHRHERNLGIAENASWVLEQPEADIVVRLDSDDLLLPDYMRILYDRLCTYPNAGYAHSAVEVIDEHDVVQSVARLYRPREYSDPDTALRDALLGYKTVANVLMFRAAALRRANYYHDRPNFAEDYDLSVRLADLGYGNVYVNEVLARYRVWGDALGARHHRKAEHLRGLTQLFHRSFVTAFERRGWDLAAVRRARSRVAVRFASAIFMPWIDDDERTELLRLLRGLDDGFRVRLRVFLLRLGFAPAFAAVARLDALLRRAVKNGLAAVRRRP